MHYQTLTEGLYAQRHSDRAITYLEPRGQQRSTTFAQLYQRALGILSHFQRRGLRPGDHLIMVLDNNQALVDGFWACLLGGIVPVPISHGVSAEQRNKLFRVFTVLNNPYLYTDHQTGGRIKASAHEFGMAAEYPRIKQRTILTDHISDIHQPGTAASVTSDDVAFIQFSSGSTSTPKGVVLTHGNLITNTRDIAATAEYTSEDISLSWMPLTHDMGLIGFHLNMVLSGMSHYLMATEVFIRRPLSWLQYATETGATVLCSPNFGYRHFLKALQRKPIDSLDLARVRLIYNGAEPISATLCDEFVRTLEPFGLRATTMYPVYGLAEASLAVSFPTLGQRYEAVSVDRRTLGLDREVVFSDDDDAITCVSVGQAIGQSEVRIGDAKGAPVRGDRVGRILIRGENVTRGYYTPDGLDRSRHTGGDWLDTGDLGFINAGRLFVTGRSKDIIFQNGQNFYAHDLENIAIQLPSLDLGKVAVGAVRETGSEHDQIVVFVVFRGPAPDFRPIAAEVAREITAQSGAEVSRVVPVQRIPKTTSGKIQRYVLEREYTDGHYDSILDQIYDHRDTIPAPDPDHSGVESVLLEICSHALDDIKLGLDDNFFEIGTNSLKLIEIHEQIQERYPGCMDITDIFDHPSLSQLASLISERIRETRS